MKIDINELSQRYAQDIVDIRRHFHQNPELSNSEWKTSGYIKEQLNKLKIPFTDGYAQTGLVGKLEFKNPSKKVIALRADMDALPIQELNPVPYKSKNKEIMHACGHDVHMASLLGVARILSDIKEELEGTILFVFQPAEEKLPGGAKAMLEEGALNAPKPDLVIGQHVMPELQAGKVAFKSGKYMASVDEIELIVHGKGGHAAMPHQITDTVLITSHIIVALQQIVSRNSKASTPTVLSFGKLTAPGAANIIPREVKVEGTFRTMDETWRYEAHEKIKKLAKSIAEGMGGSCDVNINVGYPSLINDPELTQKAREITSGYLGEENIKDLEVWMASEDFAYFTHQFPSVFYRLGIQDKEGKHASPLHSPTFFVDESALRTGVEVMVNLVTKFLSE